MFCFKTGQRGTRSGPRPGMDEGNADNTGMPRVHAPDCQVGFLHTHRIKGSHAVEGRKAMLLTCDSRCSQVPWIDAGCSALD